MAGGTRVHGSNDGELCDLESIKPRPSSERYELLEPVQPGLRGPGYWPSYITVMLISFVGFIDYAVIMPSAQDYCSELGQDKFFYGLSLSLFPLARIVLLPLAGLASDALPMRLLLFLSVFIQLLGGVTYGLAEGAHAASLLLIGRVIAGVGSTNIAMVQRFVVSTSTLENRSRAIAIMQATNFLGIALGPALNFVLANANFHLFGGVNFNKFTGAGFMLAGLHCFNLFLVVFLFKDSSFTVAPISDTDSSMVQQITRGFKGVWNTNGAAGVCTSAMIAMIWLSLLETLVAPVCKDSFGWKLQQTSVFFAIFAVLAATLMGIVGVASKCVPDRS
eukprot:TRINITY_DN10542_c0_g1_i1.p2 TRINITY_DN10542_c0_g1~~TRINITY_DN10542_c0_g1_i1.p2  ORF type:complete len:334 (+),score=68.06 TRINITY_DN10542_c0_g1_i1:213-1214(+)